MALDNLETIWLNTGTLCNLECPTCYIESSPHNDRLSFLTANDASVYLEEIRRLGLATRRVGITGGEPFVNPECLDICERALEAGFEVLVLTNAMTPMMRPRVQQHLEQLQPRFGSRLIFRVSIDHYRANEHDSERGDGAYDAAIRGTRWLVARGFRVHLAGRTRWAEDEASLREGYELLAADLGIDLSSDPEALVLFPEMRPNEDPPEITEACWEILGKHPSEVMCATSRMVVKRSSTGQTRVVACTLLPYAEEFDLGSSLAESSCEVALNHPHCAAFCVLGGGRCSS